MLSPHQPSAMTLLLLGVLLPLSAAAAETGGSRSRAAIAAPAAIAAIHAPAAPAGAPGLTPRAAQLVQNLLTRLFGAADDDDKCRCWDHSGYGGGPSEKDGSGICPHGGPGGH
ncbi:MAG TPA: hypothetical protein VOA87_22310 [Thermoanaerobaculia bacterium]|nr:hypothetical protein [Thermoanaerobaculia bacterium]